MDEERKGGLRIIRQPEVAAKLGLSESKVRWMYIKGVFPRPFVIVPGGKALGWLEGLVDEWIMDQSVEGAWTPGTSPEPEPAEDETAT